jgi:hypothetical protein
VKLVALALLALACGGPSDDAQAPPCALAVSVPGYLAPAADGAAERLRAATGCELTLSDSGTPLTFEPGVIVNELGEPACGDSLIATVSSGRVLESRGMEIDWTLRGCPTAESLILHESMHVLANPAGSMYDGGHGTDGVFAQYLTHDSSPRLTAGSLEFFCSRAACAVFEPEL